MAKPDEFDSMAELIYIMEYVAGSFVPEKESIQIKHPSMEDCIVRRLRRALKTKDIALFEETIQQYNALIKGLKASDTILDILKNTHRIPLQFTRGILNQVYARVVSPRANKLRDYKAFSNNVYGELLPGFSGQLFEETHMTSKSVFIDLGSGVGNCVIQASLEIGCESWGCEIMQTASELAKRQQTELQERLKLYGIRCGPINLLAEDFVHNTEIQKALARADVVLVNNYAFDAKLNGHLIDMFLDLKEGCKVVSLKSFVPAGHTISKHNIESPLNLLEVQAKQFSAGSVSWTIAPGNYYISTIDRTKLQKFLAEEEVQRGGRRYARN